jgi:hypothetical protein
VLLIIVPNDTSNFDKSDCLRVAAAVGGDNIDAELFVLMSHLPVRLPTAANHARTEPRRPRAKQQIILITF